MAKIPGYTIAGKTITTKAQYEIYKIWNQEVKKETKTIDQSKTNNGWVEIGTFSFEKGPNAAVRLSNISTETDETEILWADTIKWEKINPKGEKTDVSLSKNTTKIVEQADGTYDLNLAVENKSSTTTENSDICVNQKGEADYSLVESIGNIIKNTTKNVLIKLKNFFFGDNFTSSESIEVTLCNIDPEDSDISNNSVTINESEIQMIKDSDPGGVDFSEIELAGIELNHETDSIDFILKGLTNGSGNVDTQTQREKIREIFMSALAIPNWKQWISLPLGGVDIESPFEQTELSRIMLEADVNMKFDLFNPNTINLNSLYGEWVNLIKQSPYWNEIKAQGFNALPYWQTRGTIIPGETLVNTEGDQMFINSATLGIDTTVEWVKIDLSAYRLSQEASNDINTRLKTWQQTFIDRLEELEPSVVNTFQTDSKYQELRAIYPVVALAHWYKSLNRENLPYSDFIDSEDVSDLQADTPFDENYWAEQSDQFIEDFTVTDFYGNKQDWYLHGGVELSLAEPEAEGELTNEQKTIFDQVLDQYTAVQDGSDYYLYGGNMTIEGVDLRGYLTVDADELEPGKSATLKVTMTNNDSIKSTGSANYTLKAKIWDENVKINEYTIKKGTFAAVNGWETVSETINWTLPNIAGTYEFILDIDSTYVVKESVEDNNRYTRKIEVVSAIPESKIYWPETGSLIGAIGPIFYGEAYDAKDGYLGGSSLSWSSDQQGNLGTGDALTIPSLNSGQHLITLTAVDSDGNTSTTQVKISVPEPGMPTVSIASPIEGQRLASETQVMLSGEAVDYEDGNLGSDQFSWRSDRDGDLGLGQWFSVNTLSIGNHVITLKATDSDGLFTEQSVRVMVEQGPPTLTITSPSDQNNVYQHDLINFQGGASDLQDGNLGSQMEWYSSRDGLIGTGTSFLKNLSPGEHKVTVRVMDSDGQEGEKSVTVNVNYTPPEVTLTAPQTGAEFDYFDSVTLQGSANDRQDGALSGENLIWESDKNGFLGTGSPLTVSNLAPGYHTITLTAMDSDLIEISKSVTIYIDAGQPRVSIISPTNGQKLFYDFSYTFSGSVEDDRDGTLSGNALVWSSNLDGQLGTGSSITISTLSEGNHVITLRGTDSDGWVGELTRNVTVLPPHSPEVSLIKPVNIARITHGDTINLRATVSDYEDGNLDGNSVEWISDLDGVIAHGTNVNLDSTPLSLGIHTITLRATDSLGAVSEVSTSIIIENRPPVGTIISPTADNNIFVQGKDTITFQGSGIDLEDGTLSGSSLVWSSNVDGTLGTGISLTIPVSSLNPATHTIALTVTDSHGATHKDEASIIVVAMGSMLLNTFSDGSREKEFEFNGEGDQIAYMKFLEETDITNAQLNIQGETLGVLNNDPFYGIGGSYSHPTLVDIDNDGDKDMFKGTADGTLMFYKNSGSPSSPQWTLVTDKYENIDENTGSNSTIIPTFVDIDGDNDYDLFYGVLGNIKFYRNDGNPSQPLWILATNDYIDMPTYGWNWPVAPSFVDIDGDNDYDLFIADSTKIFFYRNDGTASIASWTYVTNKYENITYSYAIAPTFIDIDNDDDFDLIFGGQGSGAASALNLYLNVGNSNNPSWAKSSIYYREVEIFAYVSPSFADIDSDGDFDLYIGEQGGRIFLFENIGNAGNDEFYRVLKHYDPLDSGRRSTPIFVDIDNDDDFDLFVGGDQSMQDNPSQGVIYFYRNDGNRRKPIWTLETWEYANINDLHLPRPTFVDIDNDEDKDLFIGEAEGNIRFYENIGTPSEESWRYVTNDYANIVLPMQYADPIFIDIDNDEDYDLFIGSYFYDGSIYFYRNDGTPESPNWTLVTSQYANIVSIKQPSPYFADEDYDGDYDLFIGGGYGNLYFYRNDGDKINPIFVYVTDRYENINKNDGSGSYFNFIPTLINIDNDEKHEIFFGETGGGLNLLDHMPTTNPQIDIGANNTIEWSYSGEFIGTQTTSNFAAEMNEYLSSATPDAEGNVLVPLQFHSDTAGILKVNNVNVQYTTTDSEPPVFGGGGLVAATAVGASASNFVSPNPSYINQSITIRVSVTDNQGIASVTANINGTNVNLSHEGNNIYSATTNAPNEVGMYPVTITAIDLSGIPASITENLAVITSGKDLVVTDSGITISSNSPDEGQNVTVTATIHNFGDTQASFSADLLVSDASVSRSNSLTLNANSETVVTFNWIAQYGVTQLSVVADFTQSVGEANENNNKGTKTISVQDITPPSITDVELTNPVRVGDLVSLKIAASYPESIEAIMAKVNNQTYTLNYSEQSQKYETSFTINEGGEYPIEINATDISGLKTILTENLTVYWSRPDFELIRDDIVPLNSSPIEGEEILITLTTNNVGYEAKNNIKVQLFDNGALYNTQYVNLAAPASVNLSFYWTATMGSHNLEFVMDPENQYTETKENNNSASIVLSVDQVDIPIIENVELPENIIEEENFEVEVDLGSEGLTSSDPTGDEIVTVNTGYETVQLTFDTNTKKFKGNLNYPELGTKNLTVEAKKPQSSSHADHRKILVRSHYPDLETNEKELNITKVKPSAGENLQMTLKVKNPGGKSVNNVSIRFSVDGNIETTEEIAALNIGEEADIAFSWAAELGNHTIVFEIDPENTVLEYSEENNIITKNIEVIDALAPVLQSLTHDKIWLQGVGTSLQVSASDNVDIQRVTAQIGSDTTDLAFNSESDLFEGQITPTQEESEDLLITITDTSLLSTSIAKKIKIFGITPDLKVDAFDIDLGVNNIKEGEELEIVTKVHNQSSSQTNAFSVYLEADDLLEDFTNISLQAGEEKEVSLNYTPRFGNHTITIKLDPGNAIAESDETNNIYTTTLYAADITPPESPVLIVSPNNWSETNNFTVFWDPVSDNQGVAEYLYQKDGGQWIGNEVNTSIDINNLSEGEHILKVVARDREGNLGEAGKVILAYDITRPETPFLKESSAPYFTWTESVDIGSAVVAYKGVLNGDETHPIDLGLDTIYKPEFSDGEHTFKVKAIDALSHESDWSNEVRIKIDTLGPEIFTISSPTHPDPNASVDNNTPEFIWNTPEDASEIAGYYYLFTDDLNQTPDTKALWIENQGETNTLKIERLKSMLNPEGKPIPNGIWYLYVIAKDILGNLSTEVATYKVIIEKKGVELIGTSPLPGDRTYNVAIDTILAWSFEDSCAITQTIDFEVYLDTNAIPNTLYKTVNGSACDQGRVVIENLPQKLASKTKYYWYVVARDESGNRYQSETWSFETAKGRALPVPTSPKFDFKKPKTLDQFEKVIPNILP